MVFHGEWYDEVAVGESFGSSLTVTETPKGGIVEMTAVATNQRGEIAVQADGKMLVAARP